MSQEIREVTLEFSPGPFGDNLDDNLVNSLMASFILYDLTIIPVCCSLFGGWLILAKTLFQKRPVYGAVLLTLCFAVAAFADPKDEIPNQGPTRIKRDAKVLKTKPSGYHNRDRSPSREASNEYYLLVPEVPKTDDELDRRKVEAAQLPKILSMLKDGNFAKAQQMLHELAQSMPVDSQSRACYQRLASMCSDRMDTEYWYRYDIKDIRHAKDTRQSIADLPRADNEGSSNSSTNVHSLRKEAWFLLTAGSKN